MSNSQLPTSDQEESLSNSRFYLIFAFLVVAGLLLRWIGLDERPMHHDESLHAMFGRYFFDWPDINYYKYDPMMHGPFIYNVLRLVYNTLGSTTWAARSLTAILGSLLIFAPFFFRRYLSRQMVLALTAAISLSPTIIYWARFIREDTLQLASMLLMLSGVLLFKGGLKIYGVLFGLTLQFCIKENSFVTVAILLGYMAYETGMSRLLLCKERPLAADLKLFASSTGLLSLAGFVLGLLLLALTKVSPQIFPQLMESSPESATLAGLGAKLAAQPGFPPQILEWLYVGVMLTLCSGLSLLLTAEAAHQPELTRHRRFIRAALALSLVGLFVSGWWLTGIIAVQMALLVEALFRVAQSWSKDLLFVRSMQYLRDYWPSVLIALTMCAFLYGYLYSAGFRYSQGILDGLYRRSLVYWWGQHAIERIAGPFLFHFYVLSWYEFLFVVAILYHLFIFYRNASTPFQIAAASIAFVALLSVTMNWGIDVFKVDFWHHLNVKDVLDMTGFFVFTGHALLATTYHLVRRQQALAFWGYFFTANLFTYSFLGEKVPWLTVYAFIPGVIYLALYFHHHFHEPDYKRSPQVSWESIFMFIGFWLSVLGLLFMLEKKELGGGSENNWMFLLMGALFFIMGYGEMFTKAFGKVNILALLFIFFCAFNIREAVLTNYVYAGHASEYLSQVHTTPEFHNFVLKMKEQIKVPLKAKQTTVFGEGDVTWPITWYLVDTPEYKFIADQSERLKFDYIFRDFKENDTPPPDGFRAWKLPLRGWWVPDLKTMTLKRFLHYMLSHRPWSDTGFTYVTVWVKTDNK